MTPVVGPASSKRARSSWWVYMLRRIDGALYTGIALDVKRRLAQHCAGRGAKALRGRGPLQLVWQRRIGALGEALRIERALKRLSKAAKERLVASPRRALPLPRR